MATELPLLWYRGFHDVPRTFCVRLRDAYIVFDSAFSDEQDEYEDMYSIKRIVECEDLTADAILQRVETLEVVAHMPVNREMFDATVRASVRLPDELVATL